MNAMTLRNRMTSRKRITAICLLAAALIIAMSGIGATAQAPTPGADTAAALTCDPYEPNESFGWAWAITPGGNYEAKICDATDLDWFKFPVTAGQDIQVRLYDLPADYDVELWDPDEDMLRRSNNSSTTSEQINETAVKTGDYRVKVYGYNGAYDATTSYTLRVLVSTSACTDSWEPNETRETAASIPVGLHIGPKICSPTDVDFFKFAATAGQQIEVAMDSLPANYDMYLYNPAGGLIDFSENAGTADESMAATATTTGDHYIRVYGAAGAYDTDDAYRLRVDLTTGCTDSWEPNETWATAATMPAGLHIGPKICSASDVDWFKFAVAAGQQIEVSMDSLPANYDVALYNPAGNWVAHSQNAGAADEFIAATATSTGDYSLFVSGVAGAYDTSNNYRLRVDLGTGQVCNDPWEPNESWGAAASISTNSNVEAYICDASDVDWFKFQVTAGQQITLTLTSLPENYDLLLYSPAGAYIDGSASGGATNEQITHSAATTGAYYAFVHAPANDYDVSDSYILRASVETVSATRHVYLPLIRR
jgi:hypothetical protein